MPTSLRRAAVMALFFASGYAALVYETLWLRSLTLVLGHTTWSVSIIIAAFMGGIALGNLAFGPTADRTTRPLRLFAKLELAIGAAGLLLLGVFSILEPTYRALITALGLGIDNPIALAIEPVVAVLTLTLQTVFMGGTLPAMSRYVVRQAAHIGTGIGAIYAINTAGAVAGTLVGGFFLIPVLGSVDATIATIATSLLIGVFALVLDRGSAAAPTAAADETVSQEQPWSSSLAALPAWFFPVAYAVTGGTALAYEVLWTRQLSFFIGSGTYAFSVMLGSFLLGISLGSWLYGRSWHRSPHQLKLFGLIQLAIGASAVAAVLLFYNLSYFYALLRACIGFDSWLGVHLTKTLLSLVMVGLPTTMFGAAFPLVNRLYTSRVDHLGRGLALLTAANAAGGIVGSFAAGFILLPWVGTNASVGLIAAINLGLAAWVLAACSKGRKRAALGGAVLGTLAIAATILLLTSLPPTVTAGVSSHGRDILWQREASDATITVMVEQSGNRLLDINGMVTAADTFTDVAVHKQLAHLPMIFHPEPTRALVVGFGLGITANSVTRYDSLEQLDIVELIADEQLTAPYFGHFNRDVLSHSKVNLIVGDGRDHIGTTATRYDVISFNAVHPRVGAGLYSRDFYELCAEALAPGGIVAGWIPTNWMTLNELQSLLKTFADAFPESTLWYVNPAHLVVIGSRTAITYDYETVATRLRQPAVAEDLRETYLEDVDSFLSFYLMGAQSLRAWSQDAPLNTDTHSVVEFSRVMDTRIVFGVMESVLENRDPIDSLLRPGDQQASERLNRFAAAREDMYWGELLNWRWILKDTARQFLARAIERAPDDPYLAFIARGYGVSVQPPVGGWRAQPSAERAELLFSRSRDDDPKHRFRRGMKALRDNDGAQAVEELQMALLLKPDYVAAHTNTGFAFLSAGAHERAGEHFESALGLNEAAWVPHFHLATISAADNNFEDARSHLRAALDNNPYYVGAMTRLAHLSEPAEAEALQRRITKLNASNR